MLRLPAEEEAPNWYLTTYRPNCEWTIPTLLTRGHASVYSASGICPQAIRVCGILVSASELHVDADGQEWQGERGTHDHLYSLSADGARRLGQALIDVADALQATAGEH